MAAAYHVFKNGAVSAVTTTGLTNPDIKKNLPHGNPAGDAGVISKAGRSAVTGK